MVEVPYTVCSRLFSYCTQHQLTRLMCQNMEVHYLSRLPAVSVLCEFSSPCYAYGSDDSDQSQEKLTEAKAKLRCFSFQQFYTIYLSFISVRSILNPPELLCLNKQVKKCVNPSSTCAKHCCKMDLHLRASLSWENQQCQKD